LGGVETVLWLIL